MKIVFDHQKFTQQKYGGITRYFCNLTSGLSAGSQSRPLRGT